MALFDGTISDVQKVVDDAINRAAVVGQNLITQVSKDFEAAAVRIIDHALQGANNTLAGLNGWSMTVAPITVKLNAPKEVE